MRFTRSLALSTFTLLLASPALAQDEPLTAPLPPALAPGPVAEPVPPPPPPPAPAPAPAPAPVAQPQPAAPAAALPPGMTPRKLKDTTDTDHDMVVGDIGFQIVYHPTLGFVNENSKPTASTSSTLTEEGSRSSMASTAQSTTDFSLAEMGVRIWFTRRVGLDAGVGLLIARPAGKTADDENKPTQVGFGLTGGVPIAMGIYRHVTMFVGPELGFAILHQGEDMDLWLLDLRGKLGLEISLGFIDIPRVSLVGTFGFGLRVFNDSNSSEIELGTTKGFGLNELWDTTVGLVFYI